MDLKLKRTLRADGYTPGMLTMNDTDIGICTIEDQIREIPGVPVEEWKVPGETAIPVGTYKVLPMWFNAYERLMPQLQYVPGFTEIFIHTGNSSLDTAGCILVGKIKTQGDWIGGSWRALNELWPKLMAEWDRGLDVWITIENPDETLRAPDCETPQPEDIVEVNYGPVVD